MLLAFRKPKKGMCQMTSLNQISEDTWTALHEVAQIIDFPPEREPALIRARDKVRCVVLAKLAVA